MLFQDSKYKSFLRSRNRDCPSGYQPLHEFLFYDQTLRKEPKNRENLPYIVNDFIDHLIYLNFDHDVILEKIQQFISPEERFPEQVKVTK